MEILIGCYNNFFGQYKIILKKSTRVTKEVLRKIRGLCKNQRTIERTWRNLHVWFCKQDCKAIIPTLYMNTTCISLFDWTHIFHFVTSRVLSHISGGCTFVTKESGVLSNSTLCHSERHFELPQMYAGFNQIFFVLF